MKVLVLAGGFDQIALIQELKRRGNKVILADYLDNPPAKNFADTFYQISTLDEQAIYELAKDENVDLITTACTDQALMTVASVSEKAGLPCYLGSETARRVTNKFYMKQKFREYEIPSSNWTILTDETDLEVALVTFKRYPYIVKPCDCNSSKGVVKVNDRKSLETAVQQAFVLSRSKKVIVEDYVSGTEISVDAWIKEGMPQILAVTETGKMQENEDGFTIYQSRYPVNLSKEQEKHLYEIVKKISMAFELKTCPLLVQAIVGQDGINVIEFSARMGGGSKYKLVEYLSGIDIMKAYVDLVTEEAVPEIRPVKSEKFYELDYIYTYDGTIEKYVDFEQLKEQGKISEIFQYKMEGSIVTQRRVSGDRSLGILIEADTFAGLNQKRTDILNSTAIMSTDGKDIMYRECFLEQ